MAHGLLSGYGVPISRHRRPLCKACPACAGAKRERTPAAARFLHGVRWLGTCAIDWLRVLRNRNEKMT